MAILTISREFGSGGEEVGQWAAKTLGYELIDRQRILDDMKELGKQWGKLGEEFDEHYPSLWERYDWSFRGFVALSQSIILNYALKDKVVLTGRGGNFLLKGIPYALRIRVVAPKDKRVERIMHKEDISRETARWLIEKADSEMSRAVHLIYGKNWDNPAEYDMRFDMSVQTAEEVLTIVKEALSEKEKYNTEEAKSVLRLRVIAAKVKAGIVTNPSFLIPTLDVETTEGSLVLRGIIHNPKEQIRIEEEAKKLAEGVPIKCELHYRGLLR